MLQTNLPLSSFVAIRISKLPVSFTIKDWEQKDVKEAFIDFMNRIYPEKDLLNILKEIEKWVKALRITAR